MFSGQSMGFMRCTEISQTGQDKTRGGTRSHHQVIKFQCFATTRDGSIVVGLLDMKIRLYLTTSMKQAKYGSCYL